MLPLLSHSGNDLCDIACLSKEFDVLSWATILASLACDKKLVPFPLTNEDVWEAQRNNPEEEAPEESQQPRTDLDVSQWLVVKFVASTLLLCYCIDDESFTGLLVVFPMFFTINNPLACLECLHNKA